MSRPRRFGKSLLLSTLGEIFKGNKELFRGLWLYDQPYAWQAYSVIRLDFSRHAVKRAEQLEQAIDYFIEGIAQDYSLTLRGFDYQSRFDNLLQQLGRRGKVVLLIDEYDKPIIDNLEQPAEAERIRDVLKNFYTIIKANDEYLRFVFITGISKFSRVGLFSAMNNLNDLTQHPKFATLLGVTEAELRRDFAEHIVLFAAQIGLSSVDLLEKLRHWYNGFRFTAEGENVYNPYSILLCFHQQRFSNFWFESGTPTFLIKLLKEHNYDIQQLDELHLRELAFSYPRPRSPSK